MRVLIHRQHRTLLAAAQCRPSLIIKNSPLVQFQSTAWKSTAAASTSTGATNETVAASSGPALVKIPALPVIGSLIPQHSGIPMKFDQDKVYDFWPALREKFGDFYQIGIPGLGEGMYGTCYVLQDPHEMARILRNEGKYPSGAAESQWVIKQYFTDKHQGVGGGILSRGLEWKRIRSFVQTDLLSPQSAARYAPAVLEAVTYASKGAPHFAAQNNLNEYLNLASFDMFSNVMLGTLPRVSDPSAQLDPEDAEFCRSVAAALRIAIKTTQSPYENLMLNGLGIRTKTYKEFEKEWGTAERIANRKLEELYAKRQDSSENKMTDTEKFSYANHAFDRQQLMDDAKHDNEEMHVTLEEAKVVVTALISAGVDTTGNQLTWKLLHLAMSGEAQDKVFHEVSQNTASSNGKLTPESLSSSQAPYLHACVREAHRLTSSAPTIPIKRLPQEMMVHGELLPANSVMILDGYSTGVTQEHFDLPVLDYHPERFLPEAVAARKGTSAGIVDHSFFAGPFSQGARKCPGSRVAKMETVALLAQLVLDYEMSVPSVKHWPEVPYGLETLTTVKLPPIEFKPRVR